MDSAKVFDRDETLIVLDKPYLVRFTMQAVYELEKQYESITAALAALCGDDATQATKAVVDFLCALTEATAEVVVGSLDEARFPDAYKGLFQTIRRDIPFKEGERPPEDDEKGSCDWDRLYYLGRDKLCNFYPTDDAFWQSTPRRFWKLYELWLWGNGHDDETERIEDMEVYMGELDI